MSAELRLRLEREPEETIEGWHVADGHWMPDAGIGVLLIVSADARDRIVRGVDARGVLAAVKHCTELIVARRLREVERKARRS